MSPTLGLKEQFEADWTTHQREYQEENDKEITLTYDNFHKFCDEWLQDLPIRELDRYIEEQGGVISLLKEYDDSFGDVGEMVKTYEEWRIKACLIQSRLREAFSDEIAIAEQAL